MLDKITGEIRVYPKEIELRSGNKKVIFSGCVGSSKVDDEWLNYYMLINFSNELKKEIAKVYKQDSFDILISDSWIKPYLNQDNNAIPILFVNKAKVITAEEKTSIAKKSTKTKKSTKENVVPVEDELPF